VLLKNTFCYFPVTTELIIEFLRNIIAKLDKLFSKQIIFSSSIDGMK